MKSKQTIEQAIESVTNSPSTIFHKDDVMRIISGIEVTNNATMSETQIENLASEISTRISNRITDIAELESVTVSVGGYGNGVDDANWSVDEDRIVDIVYQVLTNHFMSEAEPVSTENTL